MSVSGKLMIGACAVVALAGCSESTQADAPPAASPTITQSDSPTTDSATPLESATSTPSTSSLAPGQVDPAQFASGDSYFFHSPTGSFLCGITAGPNALDGLGAGCQGPTTPAPPEQQQCWAQGPNYSAVAVGEAGAKYLCLNQGVFVGPPLHPSPTGSSRGGWRELPYGSSLSARGYTCTSREDGVTCVHDASGHGFRIARQSNATF